MMILLLVYFVLLWWSFNKQFVDDWHILGRVLCLLCVSCLVVGRDSWLTRLTGFLATLIALPTPAPFDAASGARGFVLLLWVGWHASGPVPTVWVVCWLG